MMLNKTNYTTQIDYLIENNIFRLPNKVNSDMNIKTEWFDGLTTEQQNHTLEEITERWWSEYGLEQMNELYSDTIIKTEDFRGDITDFWIKYLENEKDELEKYLGIEEYREKINKPLDLDIPDNPFDDLDSDDEIYTDEDDDVDKVNEWSMKLGDFLNLNNFQLKVDEKNEIKKSLQRRRQNGGCSLWRNWGIKWMVDNGFYDELLDWEKEWFIGKFGNGRIMG